MTSHMRVRSGRTPPAYELSANAYRAYMYITMRKVVEGVVPIPIHVAIIESPSRFIAASYGPKCVPNLDPNPECVVDRYLSSISGRSLDFNNPKFETDPDFEH
ncbi:hypothetical protein EVAR_47168_1 [Eumeta japonica]|uniref:Uncharacterized protein n=1 Tax=Eumeta variegata TaxID=151549 RepID=A0A4C1WT49_EUMVA|nr:hypothetical protein EVAR_47168_1 [Eumeta japonica]